MRQIERGVLAAIFLTAVGGLVPAASRAQAPAKADTSDRVEQRVKRMRQGAGLRGGAWTVSNLDEPSGTTSSSIPAFEGYWQKGLDRHLAIETSAGLWHRQQRSGSGSTAESVGSFIVPLLTTIKVFPFTGPEEQLEPFISAGAGFVLGIENQSTVSGGLLGGGGANSGLNIVAGIGAKGSAGVEYRFSQAFGVSAAAAYQYVWFAQDVGGQSSYKGFMLLAGLTYRFQY